MAVLVERNSSGLRYGLINFMVLKPSPVGRSVAPKFSDWLESHRDIPCVLGGDVNPILFLNEKQESIMRLDKQEDIFNEIMKC